MNTEIIASNTRATLAGTISFPDVVAALIATGVEYYHIDYAALRMTVYNGDGATIVMPIPYEGLPPIASEFHPENLKAVILDSQRHCKNSATSPTEPCPLEYKATSPSYAANASPMLAAPETNTPNGFR